MKLTQLVWKWLGGGVGAVGCEAMRRARELGSFKGTCL